MNKILKVIYISVSAISILGCAFVFRWILFVQADPGYLEDFYNFSQWSVPFSSRVMGDSLLYQFSGISLLNNFEPFQINPETPILGKLLIAFSIKYTGNPHIISIFMLISLLTSLNLIAKKHLSLDQWKRSILLLLIGTSPIVLNQLADTVLDLSQITFYIIHVYFLFSAGKSKNKLSTYFQFLFSGLALGAMISTKTPLYFPIILIVDSWYLFKRKKLIYIVEIFFLSLITYTFTYFPYILKYGLTSWLDAQKWMINFYLKSQVNPSIGMIFITAISGWYKGWWGTGWERVVGWSGTWALGIFASIIQAKNFFINKNKVPIEETYFILISFSILLILVFLPFWPRYFVFLVPIFWINIFSLLKSHNYFQNTKVLIFLAFIPLIHTTILAANSIKFEPSSTYHLWEKASFKDMYNDFSINYKQKISRDLWATENQSEIEKINANSLMLKLNEPTDNGLFNKSQTVLLKRTGPKYATLAEYQVNWIFEYNQWKIDSITDSNTENRIEYNKELPGFVCVNTTKVESMSEVHKQIGYFLKISMQEASDRIMKFSPRNYCIPVGKFSERQEEKPIPYVPGVMYKNFNKNEN